MDILKQPHAKSTKYRSINEILSCMLLGGLLVLPALQRAGAQTGNGRILGAVEDPQKRMIPNAHVVLTEQQTGLVRTTKTNGSGDYAFPQVPLGVYSIQVDVNGFASFQRAGFKLTADQNLTIPVDLTLRGSTESVTVSEQGTLVDTQTGTIKSIVDEKSITDLPLSGRDVRQLIALSQGVVATASTFNSSAQSSTLPGTPFFSVNGGRSNTLNYLLDGIDNNDSYTNVSSPYPDPDALAQFSVQVSNFDAEYGRNSGAIVNAITKSGTNKLHGSAYEFQQNSTFGLDAVSSITKSVGGHEDILHFNQFGGSLGGPVILPGLYNGRDRTFIFGSYQQTISHSASTVNQEYVPTQAERIGDFRGSGITLKDPRTGLPFPNNMIPADRIDSAAQLFLNTYEPLPNSSLATQPNLFTFKKPALSTQGQLTLRGDHKLSTNNQLALTFYRYTSDIGTLAPLPGNLAYAQAGFTGVEHHATISLTSVLSPRLVNLFSVGYSHLHTHPGSPPPGYPTSHTLGLNIYSIAPNPLYFSIAGFSGATAVYQGLPNNRNNFPVQDALSIQLGKHSLKIGGEASRMQQHWIYNQAFPNLNFNGMFTSSGLGDFLLGMPQYLVEANTQELNTRFTQLGFYVQDNWKVSERLTLDLGVRWDPFIPPHFVGKFNPIDVFSPKAFANGRHSTVFPNAPAGLLFAGDQGVPNGGTSSVYTNVSPRVGFAYDLSGKQDTVLRGAYGIFYDQPKAIDYNRFTNGQPFNIFEVLYNTKANPYNWQDPYQGGVDPVAAFASQANKPGPAAKFSTPIAGELAFVDFHMPNVQEWNLTLEHQLPRQTLMRITYVGNKATHLQWTRDANAPRRQAGPSSTWSSPQSRRPYAPAFSYINGLFWDGYSEYQSVQVSLEHRFSQGLSGTLNYTHARTFDSNSDSQEFIATGVQNPYNLRQEYGPSDFDIPNNFIASAVYELPIPSTGNRFADLFVRGYQVNTIVSVHSAPPFSIYSTTDNELTTEGYQRDQLVGNPKLPNRGPKLPFSTYYNTAAYSQKYTPDNDSNISGRNSQRGPGYANIDLSAFKNVNFERTQLQLRVQAFNAFNNASLGIDGASQYQSSPNFGKLTTGKGGRLLQFGARLTF